MSKKAIKRALISVYYKEGIDIIARLLERAGVEIYSTGGTYDYLASISVPVKTVESITEYPSILGGRVKTLHPKVFGGILWRRDCAADMETITKHEIPSFDLVIVDLYPFEESVARNDSDEEIIEKIDIGGISLIRAAAKNFESVVVVPCKDSYSDLIAILEREGAVTTLEERRKFAGKAFQVSSLYDLAIFEYFSAKRLRYGENPHQKASFCGDDSSIPKQLHGKELSYNNLLDVEAAIELISDFEEPTVAVIKHNNACGIATRASIEEAWRAALNCDPISAFGGIIIANREIDEATALDINKIFFEVVLAPKYSDRALEILKEKKNRIILVNDNSFVSDKKIRSMLGGILIQERDSAVETTDSLQLVTSKSPSSREVEDLIFANKVVKHSKSNAIVLAKDGTLLASGIGQTSRVDALKQAIEKATSFGFSLQGAVMASDAFFPFSDCVEIADKSGIVSVIQPGGSIRDKDTIDYCNAHDISMVITHTRHFKH